MVAAGAGADAPVTPGGVRADGIVAVVGGTAPGPGVDVVLSSDVELRARIALSSRVAGSAASVPLPGDLRAAALEQIVGELLIAREAERVRVASPTEAELRAERDRLEAEAGSADRLRALMRRLGAGQEELAAVVRRRALVGGFMRANLEGITVVTDAEIDRAYAAGDHPFADRPLPEVREGLRAWLSRLALDRAVRRWIGVLRARTPVTVMVRFEGGAAP